MPTYKYLVVAAAFVAAFSSCGAKRIEHGAVSHSSVSANIPGDVDTVARAISELWPQWPTTPPPKLDSPFDRFVRGAMPSDFDLGESATLDPELAAYVKTGSQERHFDVYIYDPLHGYWPTSEYSYNGRPAEFTSAFIIHLASSGTNETNIGLIEYQPQVSAGSRFGWSAHSGPLPGFTSDVRWVAPTTEDRRHLLATIMKALGPLKPQDAGAR